MSRTMRALWIISIGLQCLCVVGFIRLQFVTGYRRALLRDVSYCAKVDVAHKREFQWRYEAFDAVTFDDMMIHAYKPLSWFYSSTEFSKCDR